MAILTGKLLIFFCLNCMYLIKFLIKAQPAYVYHFCQNGSNYTRNSSYRTNLDAAMSSLPNTNSGYGFYNVSVGQGLDTAYAISLCRGDVDRNMCQRCLNASTVRLRENCPNQREAIVYYDICLLRYSNGNIFENVDLTRDMVFLWNVNNASNKARFNEDLRTLMDKLREDAAAGGSLLKFALGNTSGPDFATIYGLAQCIPNLSQQQCNDCLEAAINEIPNCCDGKLGGRVLSASCNFRYEIYQLAINTSVIPPPPSPPSLPPLPVVQRSPPLPPTPGKNSSRTRTIVIVVISTVTAIIVASIGASTEDLLSYAWKCWREGTVSDMIDPTLMMSGSGLMQEIVRSTHIGLLCVQNNVTERPTMASIALMLNSFSLTLRLPSEPAFFMSSGADPEMPVEEYTSSGTTSGSGNVKRRSSTHSEFSENEASISEIVPR